MLKVKNSLRYCAAGCPPGKLGAGIATNIVTWSDEVFRIFGEQPQSFQPTYEIYLSYLEPEDQERSKRLIADAIENKNRFEVELKIIRKDGSIAYIRELGYVNFNASGEAAHVIGTTLDITDIKNSEQIEKMRFEQLERFQDALLEWSSVDYKNVEEALQRATEISAQTLDVERVSIWLYNADRTSIRCEVLYLASTAGI